MRLRTSTPVLVGGAVVAFFLVRPAVPSTGSDCEVLSGGLLREPVGAISALAIVAAGWMVMNLRPVAGSAILSAGAASFAAHATAHPVARVLDGVAAAAAVLLVTATIIRARPRASRLIPAGLTGGIGLLVWALTRSGASWCDALGPPGHAIWHVLIAAAAVLAIRAVETTG